MYVQVAIDLALNRPFTYKAPIEIAEKLRVGQLLRVPFSGRIARGFALSLLDEPPDLPAHAKSQPPVSQYLLFESSPAPMDDRFKSVISIEDEVPFFSPAMLRLVKWIADYTASPIETCLRAAVPAAVLKPSAKPKELLYVEPTTPQTSQPSNHQTNKPTNQLTPRQRALYDNLVRVGGGWMRQVVQEFKTTPGTLRALEERGAVRIFARAARRDPLAGRCVLPTQPLPLNDMQAKALEVVLGSAAVAGRPPYQCGASTNQPSNKQTTKPILLHGVTGSGKTEIYLQAIAHMLDEGKGAIVLVPEISLTPQTVRRFAGRFGGRVAVLHSALSDGERYDEWHRIRTGEARVVVGPRSAVFAPVKNLGLIVVDEEHDSSYKQDETPRYNARDVAIMRAKLEGASVVMGSATPSLESWLNVQKGKYVLASVPSRVAGRALPDVHIVDMQEEQERTGHLPIYSDLLLDAVRSRLERGEQTILFLNRRGFSRILRCDACGWIATCPNCLGRDSDDGQEGLPYTWHKVDDCLRCHICGTWERTPHECPECHSQELSYTGIGTQRAEEALKRCFPSAKVLRMDADSTSRKFSHDDILSAFRAGKADVLLGTQMIAKGLDFPNVTLVGVLNADASLNMPDFRAAERTFQLLAQVSGRAGRAEKPGEVYIQTFSPNEAAVKLAASAKYEEFANGELSVRRDGYYPPYCHLATLVFRSKEEKAPERWADLYAKSLAAYAEKYNAQGKGRFVVSEAIPSALAKAEGWYRWQLVLRAPTAAAIAAGVKWIREARPVPDGMRVSFDVDAVSLV